MQDILLTRALGLIGGAHTRAGSEINAAQIDALPSSNGMLQKNRPNDKCP